MAGTSFLDHAIDSFDRRMAVIRSRVRSGIKQGDTSPIVAEASGSFSGLTHAETLARQAEFYGHYRGWAYTAISRIATMMAGQPLRMGMVERPLEMTPRFYRRHKRLTVAQKLTLPRRLKVADTQIEPIESHEVLDAFDNPNPAMPLWGLMNVTAASLEVGGIAYWWFPRTDDGMTIWPLPADWVTPVHTRERLYDHYSIRPSGQTESHKVNPREIAAFPLPDPSNPLQTLSPLRTQSPAVATDEQMQIAQHRSFKNNLFPGLMLRTGRTPDVEGKPGVRPVLTPAQRSQLISAVRAIYEGVVNYNEPLIIDGLIEGAEPFTRSPREMDFLQSGKSVRSRIFLAFGVNPIVAGEIEGANRAQAAVAQQMFYEVVVNPLLELMGQVMTNWARIQYGPEYVLWFEQARTHDAELSLKEWDTGLKNGCATRNEYRTNVLGLPRIEEGGWDDPPMPPGFVSASPRAKGGMSDGDRKRHRALVAGVFEKQLDQAAGVTAKAMKAFFDRQVRKVKAELIALASESPQMLQSADAAQQVAEMIFRPREWDQEVKDAAFRPLVQAMAAGYAAEKALVQARGRKELTPEEIQILEFELPESVLGAARASIDAQMSQEYWAAMNDTTLRGITTAVRSGIEQGMSVSSIARAIDELLDQANRARANNIARTETKEALNAGHYLQTSELENQGIGVTKTWVTVGDNDVRPAHIEMEGVVVDGADGLFNVDGYEIPYPGHFVLPPSLRCNCRCSYYTDTR